MAIEALVLARLRRLPPATIIAAALPGALIVAALRAALVEASWPWIALPLLAAWPAHLGDIALRMRAARALHEVRK